MREVEKQRNHGDTCIPEGMDYAAVSGLSAEVCQKLSDHKPATVGQASRIPGITPAAISLLLVSLKKRAPKNRPTPSQTTTDQSKAS